MTAQNPLQAVTANRLKDGVPVYLTANGLWSPDVAAAAQATDATELLRQAAADPLNAIGPYAIDIVVTDQGVRPVGLREEIRAFGPTA